MSEFGNVAFDPKTLAILEGVFDEAWASIQAQRNGNTTRAALAERILNLAVKGERSPARLLDGALSRLQKGRGTRPPRKGARRRSPGYLSRFRRCFRSSARTTRTTQRLYLTVQGAEGSSCEGWKLMHRQGRRSFDCGDALLDRLLHLLEGAHLELAYALARHAELVG